MYENLKLHREVVDQVKYQLWPLDKKLRMIRQAKNISKMDATIKMAIFKESVDVGVNWKMVFISSPINFKFLNSE